MTYTAPPGVFDIVPFDEKDPWKSSYLWQHVEATIRTLAQEYGFREIRTPLFEKTELLARGVGDTSDIVTKEMYSFEDKGGRNLTLRPEGTAPAIRAYIENQLIQKPYQQKLYYIAPMFRYERSQAGRYRQHHQFGVEAIGNGTPETDAEIIDMAYTLYGRLGIKNLTVYINSLGTPSCREQYREALKKYLTSYFDSLSKESQARFEKNPLRILDSKDPEDQKIVSSAPTILQFLCEEGKRHFEKVQSLLKALQIPFQVNPLLVRGLDYYNNTVFEIVSGNLGAQNSIGGGGRYDGLIRLLGGPDLPAFGFGTGIERIVQTMLNQQIALPSKPATTLFIIPLGEAARETAFRLQKELRQAHISVETDFSNRKLGKLMNHANEIGATFVGILGDDELKEGVITLKEMHSGHSSKIPLKNLIRILEVETRTDKFLASWIEITKPFENQIESDYFAKKISESIKSVANANENLVQALHQIKTLLQS